jgi:arginine:pyruvate transaminase
LAQSLATLSQALLFGVSQFSQDAAEFALANDLESVPSMVDTFRQRRDRFCAELADIEGIKVYRPDGGMFLLVGIGDLGMDGNAFANELLDETGVAVVPGFAFGDSVENFVRIGFLRDEEVLSEAAKRIRQFVKSKHPA